MLIFSLNESRHFQGFAEMLSLPNASYQKNVFNSAGSGGENVPVERQFQQNFKVRWLKQCNLRFTSTMHLRNPLNENQPVKGTSPAPHSRSVTRRPGGALRRRLHPLPDDDRASRCRHP